MSDDESEYILGTGGAELTRLGFQHQVWAAATARAWERAGFSRGASILDLGCGPGYATFDLAGLVGPAGRVVAVDVSDRFIRHLNAERSRRGVENIETVREDLARLSVPASTMDGAFARWVLCFVSDPQAIVSRVAETLRPGGTFAVMDYYRYESFTVAPRSEAIERVVAAVARSFRRDGGNPDIGCELPAMMRRAGLEVRSVRPIVRVARPGSALWEWPATFFANYLPSLVQMGELTENHARAFTRDWGERSRSPDAFLTSPPMVEVIGVNFMGSESLKKGTH